MATITIKTRYILIAVLVAILALFVTGYVVGHHRADRVTKATTDALNKEILRYSTELEKKTVYISQIEQELLTLKEAKKEGLVTNEALKKLNIKTLNELTKTKLTLKIARDSVKHNGRIITIHDTVYKDIKCIELPFSFADSSAYVNLWGEFSIEGTMNYGVNVPINVDIYTGIDKKSKKPTADVVIDNPYVTLNSISSIKLDIPKVKKWGIGISAGYAIVLSKQVTTAPFVGISLNRNIIRF